MDEHSLYQLWLRKWIKKFTCAGRGLLFGIEGQISFYAHFAIAALVLIVAIILRAQLWQWCTLLMCIGLVLTAELANSAIEELASALCREHNPKVGRALDISAGAVLMASITAACVGLVIFFSLFFSSPGLSSP